MTVELILLGCTKRKRDHAASAGDIYDASQLFRARRAYAIATGRPWAILSALHGLLDPVEVVEPYDVTVSDFNLDHLDRWAAGAWRSMLDRWPELVAVELHAGAAYARPLARTMPPGVSLRLPLKGLGIGDQLGWYPARTARAKARQIGPDTHQDRRTRPEPIGYGR